MCEEYSAFLIPSAEGKRESIAPEDWDDYLEQRERILEWLRST